MQSLATFCTPLTTALTDTLVLHYSYSIGYLIIQAAHSTKIHFHSLAIIIVHPHLLQKLQLVSKETINPPSLSLNDSVPFFLKSIGGLMTLFHNQLKTALH